MSDGGRLMLAESLKDRRAKLRKSIERLAKAYSRGALRDACDVLVAIDRATLFAVELKLAELESEASR